MMTQRDKDMTLNNLKDRHSEGRLVPELWAMKIAAEVVEAGRFSVRDKDAAAWTFEKACEVAGTTPEAVKGEGDFVADHQVRVRCMVGPAMFLGDFAARQPADFYIDDRVGRLPYPKKEIYRTVKELVAYAEARGLDPHALPPVKLTHNMGLVF